MSVTDIGYIDPILNYNINVTLLVNLTKFVVLQSDKISCLLSVLEECKRRQLQLTVNCALWCRYLYSVWGVFVLACMFVQCFCECLLLGEYCVWMLLSYMHVCLFYFTCRLQCACEHCFCVFAWMEECDNVRNVYLIQSVLCMNTFGLVCSPCVCVCM